MDRRRERRGDRSRAPRIDSPLALARTWPVPIRTHEGGTRAAVLFFHGLRSASEALDREARAIAAAGVTALLVDAPHHGARRSAFLDTMPDTATEEGYARLLTILREARDEVPVLVDHALALGYERVAIGGVSMGAYIALAAATIEPRVAAIVSILGSPEWGDGTIADSPHRKPEAFAPRPLLLLNGALDVNVAPGPARALAAALRPSYEAVGAADALVHREWDVSHFVPEPTWSEMIAQTTAFLSRSLLR